MASAGNGAWPKATRMNSDDVRLSEVTNCFNTCTFNKMRPASCWRWSAAASVFSCPKWCSQYSGLRLSSRANSGAPTYSKSRGSCSWIPYVGLKSGPPDYLLYDVMRYWQPRIPSSTRGEAPDVGRSWWTSKGPSRDKSGILWWLPAISVSPAGEDTTDPGTTIPWTIRQGVRGAGSNGSEELLVHSSQTRWRTDIRCWLSHRRRRGESGRSYRSGRRYLAQQGLAPSWTPHCRTSRRSHPQWNRVHERQHRNRGHGIRRRGHGKPHGRIHNGRHHRRQDSHIQENTSRSMPEVVERGMPEVVERGMDSSTADDGEPTGVGRSCSRSVPGSTSGATPTSGQINPSKSPHLTSALVSGEVHPYRPTPPEADPPTGQHLECPSRQATTEVDNQEPPPPLWPKDPES